MSGNRQQCKACGSPDKWNFHVPDAIWLAVVPASLVHSVVCLACFDGFAKEKDVDYATSLSDLYFVGDQATLSLSVILVT